ncbi:MAG: hypothetical protein K2I88_02295 [Anaeroplasmataceae bacterium]|nr:hypothetical protein [Anaeroplasmataceae bacterium]
MKNQDKNTFQAYALYTYIEMKTEAKCGVTSNTYTSSHLNPITNYKAKNRFICYAIKRCFSIEIEEKKPMRYINDGRGFIEGFYFSIAECSRVICVCVSRSPIGVSIQVPFSIYDELEYVNHNFNKNEIEEYQKRKYGDETYFYIFGQKRAYQKKNNISHEGFKNLDSTQEQYSIHKENIFEQSFIFFATGNVEFEKINDEEILP